MTTVKRQPKVHSPTRGKAFDLHVLATPLPHARQGGRSGVRRESVSTGPRYGAPVAVLAGALHRGAPVNRSASGVSRCWECLRFIQSARGSRGGSLIGSSVGLRGRRDCGCAAP
jgi:hypothetical protein